MFKLAQTGFTFFKRLLYIVSAIFIILGLAFQFGFKKDTSISTSQVMEYEKSKIYSQLQQYKSDTTPEGKANYILYKISYCSLLGQACDDDPNSKKNDLEKSFMSTGANAISFTLLNPPASGIQYVAGGLKNAGFIPQTFAAEGIGFAAIKPISSVWRTMRDIAYLVLVIVMVAIGFMIMFRTQIDAQTVISIENSLPRIVITLILITFSFPIAGFLIDLMYLFISLIVSILATDPSRVGQLQNQYLAATPGQIFDSLIPLNSPDAGYWYALERMSNGLIPANFFDAIGTIWQTAQGLMLILPEVIKGFLYLVGIWGSMILVEKLLVFTKALTEPLSGIGALTVQIGNIPQFVTIPILVVAFVLLGLLAVQLILMILILFTVCLIFFRIFFMLLSTYLKILMLIIFSPVILLLGALPGQEAFGQWFKNIFGEIMTFPAVVALFMVANRITVTILESAAQDQVFLPGINETANLQKTFWTPPFLYGLNQEAFAFIVGMGILFIIPDLIKVMKESLGVSEFPVKVGFGTFLQGGSVAVGGGISLLTQFSSINQALLGDNRGLIGGVKRLLGRDKGDDVPAISNAQIRQNNQDNG